MRVKANLFYSLPEHSRFPAIGDSLLTRPKLVG